MTSNKILYGIVITLAIPSFVLGLSVSIECWVIGVYVSRMNYFVRLITLV